jgi:hypothetical protein
MDVRSLPYLTNKFTVVNQGAKNLGMGEAHNPVQLEEEP